MIKSTSALSPPMLLVLCLINFAPAMCSGGQANPVKTCFQTAVTWQPKLDLRSDVAIIYGMNATFLDRLQSWRDHGYGIHFMTGVAWGGYQDYLQGRFDGVSHMDEGQVNRGGEIIWHNQGTVPYMVPTASYVEYLKSLIKQAIDAGVSAIHLEEPEFWCRGGYSEGFKREWQEYYHEPWQPQHKSPDATYRSSKLKYHLYFRALKELFLYAKETSEARGQRVKCYVPTHTLINYSAWGIVSPEGNLANLPGMDGYIGQVWTGTSRTPVYYEGVKKERTFENAFLEYASMVAMTKPTGRKVFFLTDPIEDNPNHTWEDYKLNYEATFTAQLMHPSVANYEVMPWPSRIFLRTYKTEDSTEPQPIPPDYATEILVLINALNDMPRTAFRVGGTQGIGVLLSDTMMFQRFPTHGVYDDPQLSNFYGMCLPLLKHGIPVHIVQMENLIHSNPLDDTKVLIMSYANMKPLKPEYHQVIADWVKGGGALIYIGRDDDPFQQVREWWNEGQQQFDAPSQHLFKLLKVTSQSDCTQAVGEGLVTILRKDPKELIMKKEGGELRQIIKRVFLRLERSNKWRESNYLHLRRGAYDIAAVLDESISDKSYVIEGPVIDLYNAGLPIVPEKRIQPGERSLLLNLNHTTKKAPAVLAAASRLCQENVTKTDYQFVVKGPFGTRGIARILCAKNPRGVRAEGAESVSVPVQSQWDNDSRTLLVRYPNFPDGVKISVKLK